MSAAVIVLLAIIVVAILVIAAFLISFASSLMRVASNLSTVNSAISQIPRKTEPVPQILDSLRRDLAEAQSLLEGILAKPRGGAPAAPGPAPRGARTPGGPPGRGPLIGG